VRRTYLQFFVLQISTLRVKRILEIEEAMRITREVRVRPELALTRLPLAELLLDHYPDEKTDVLEHLDFAIQEFREMKMKPSLGWTLRHKKILGG